MKILYIRKYTRVQKRTQNLYARCNWLNVIAAALWQSMIMKLRYETHSKLQGPTRNFSKIYEQYLSSGGMKTTRLLSPEATTAAHVGSRRLNWKAELEATTVATPRGIGSRPFVLLYLKETETTFSELCWSNEWVGRSQWRIDTCSRTNRCKKTVLFTNSLERDPFTAKNQAVWSYQSIWKGSVLN